MWWLTSNIIYTTPCSPTRTFPRRSPMDLPPSPEQLGEPSSAGRGGRGNIRTASAWLVVPFAATHSPWQQGTVQQESPTSAPSGGVVVRCGSSSSSGGEVAATAPLWRGNTIVAAPYPQGMIPCNLHRHADAICILAKVQPKVVKQLVASAKKDLINTLLECASNIFNGNMILQPPQKHHLSSHADALMADSESARQEGPNDGRQLCGPAGRQCGFPVPEGPPLNRG